MALARWNDIRHPAELDRLRGTAGLMQVLRIVFAAGFTFLTCLFLGRTLLKIVRARLYRSEELFFGFVLGSACLSTIVLFAGLLGLAYSWVFLLIGFASFATAYACGAI